MRLRTLGGLTLLGAGFKRPKLLLLLAYLALEGPQDRRFLSELFWPTASDSRQSLTVALSQLRSVDPQLLTTQSASISTLVECDATQLRAAATRQDWERVRGLYGGTFLMGVDVEAGNVELEEWLYASREQLALQAQTAFIELAERSLREGDLLDAGQHAEHAATTVPLEASEAPQIERLYAVMAATNSPRLGALRKEVLELGIPLPEQPPHHKHVTRHSLPSDLTPFVGREDELASLEALLVGGARLITVTGLGGIGKTRLAVEFARRQAKTMRYHQVHFVPLGGAKTDEQFEPLLAAMLGGRNRRSTDPVAGAARPRASLLLLDDFVPTATSREQVEALLSSTPLLDVLITSREPLGSLAETQYQLSGLASTQPAAPGGPVSDALALYVQTAKRFDPWFEPDAASVGAICDLVVGSPLGIELAAALTPVLPTRELLTELRLTLDVLEGGQSGQPQRHQSVRAIFDSSWLRLTAAERIALAGCALFQGGFTRAAAAAVLAIDVKQLSALLERSLIRRQDNRFQLHPLVQQYAYEKLDDYPETALWRERHAAHYAAWFDSKRHFDQRSGQRQALDELELDFANLKAAWQWAASSARTDLLEQAIFMVSRFLLLRGRTSELGRLLEEADAVTASDSLLHARVLRWQAVLTGWQDPAGSLRLLTQALAIHNALKRQDDLAMLHYQLGLVSAFQSDYEAARRYWHTAIPLLEKRDDEELLGAAYSNLSLVTELADEHEALARRAHDVCVQRGATAQLAICFANEAGQVHYTYGDSATAVAYLEAAIGIEESEGGRDDYLERFYDRQAYELINLGQLERAEERLAAAYQLIAARETHRYPESGRFPPIELTSAQLHDARGQFEAARTTAQRAPADRLCTETLCRLALDAGDIDQAEQHLAVLGTLRGYGFSVRARLHERAVESLLTGEIARAHSLTAANDRIAAHLRGVALEALGAALDDALTYTFVPLALEVFTATYALDASLCRVPVLALAARHPASRYFVRRRASAMLPGALTPADQATVADWLKVPPLKLVPIVTELAELMRETLVVAGHDP